MIRQTDVFSIGHFYKTHGVSGELAFSFTSAVFDRTASPYWVIEMEGILVPFFIQSCRIRSDASALVLLDGVGSEQEAKQFVGKEVFYPVALADEEIEEEIDVEENLSDLIGFQVTDEENGPLGKVVDVDDSTINVLLMVSDGHKDYLIPAAGDYLTRIDAEARHLWVKLPEELLKLQE